MKNQNPFTGELSRNIPYVRFSDPEQGKGASIETQIQAAQAWCNARGEKLSEKHYIDRGVSAKDGGNREDGTAFAEMIADVNPGDRILMYDNDRFGRDNALDVLVDLRSVIRSKKISVVFLSSGVEVTEENFNRNDIIFQNFIKAQLANEENEKKRKRINDAIAIRAAKIAAGEIVRKNRSGRNIENVPAWIDSSKSPWDFNDKAEIVRSIFTQYLKGIGPAAMARDFNGKQIPSLKAGHRKGASGIWQQSVVYHLLSDRRVIGEYKNGGSWVPNYYPALIDADTFNRVQAKLHGNKGKRPTGEKTINIFSQIARCTCGGKLGKKKDYLYCYNRINGLGCKAVATQYLPFENSFKALLYMSSQTLVQDSKGNTESARTQILLGEKAAVEKQINNIQEFIRDGLASRKMVADQIALEKRSEEIDAELKVEAARTTALDGATEKLADIVARLDNLQNDPELRGRVRDWMIEHVNRIVVDTAAKTYSVDLKTGNLVTLGIAKGNVIALKSSYTDLFLNKPIDNKPVVAAEA